MIGEEAIKLIVQNALIDNFNISKNNFQWDTPLSTLNKDFKILGVLLDLEKILNNSFKIPFSLLRQIDTTSHTPMDVVILIKKHIGNH